MLSSTKYASIEALPFLVSIEPFLRDVVLDQIFEHVGSTHEICGIFLSFMHQVV